MALSVRFRASSESPVPYLSTSLLTTFHENIHICQRSTIENDTSIK